MAASVHEIGGWFALNLPEGCFVECYGTGLGHPAWRVTVQFTDGRKMEIFDFSNIEVSLMQEVGVRAVLDRVGLLRARTMPSPKATEVSPNLYSFFSAVPDGHCPCNIPRHSCRYHQ